MQSIWRPDFNCTTDNPCVIELDPDSPGQSQQLRFIRRCVAHPNQPDASVFGQIKAAMRARNP